MIRRNFLISYLAAATLVACSSSDTPVPATPQIESKLVSYEANGTALQGYMVWDAAQTGTRPGVIVVHEWWGHNEFARETARKLAEEGFVAFALDMYGEGKVTTHPAEAEAMMMEAMADSAALRARFDAALFMLKADPHVNAENVAAIGFCFGGGIVLSQARAGSELDAVVSLHGALGAVGPLSSPIVHSKVLILTGADDPMATPEQLKTIVDEMQTVGASVTVMSYAGVRHAFMNPDADKAGVEALHYDAEAAAKAWTETITHLRNTWGMQE